MNFVVLNQHVEDGTLHLKFWNIELQASYTKYEHFNLKGSAYKIDKSLPAILL